MSLKVAASANPMAIDTMQDHHPAAFILDPGTDLTSNDSRAENPLPPSSQPVQPRPTPMPPRPKLSRCGSSNASKVQCTSPRSGVSPAVTYDFPSPEPTETAAISSPLRNSGAPARSPLDSRLRRQQDQCYTPGVASIVAAAQGLPEESIMILAELVNFVAKAQGGRASVKQRRGAVADQPKTADYIADWLDQENTGGRRKSEEDLAPPAEFSSRRRSISCPVRVPDKAEPGFEKGTRVVATKDIKAKGVVVVKVGTPGIVRNAEKEGGKIGVHFDQREDGVKKAINVKAEAIARDKEPLYTPITTEGEGTKDSITAELRSELAAKDDLLMKREEEILQLREEVSRLRCLVEDAPVVKTGIP